MSRLNQFSNLDSIHIIEAVQQYGTPLYIYDEDMIRDRCRKAKSMPNAYGITVRYAMKANSNRTLLQIVDSEGIHIDASSLNEALRAELSGIAPEKIMLTTQEVPLGEERKELERLMLKGMRYNVCSLRQLYLIGEFAEKHRIDLSMRIHPGVGAGESASRNTGDKYSCFGVHASDWQTALAYVKERGIRFTMIHVHIGSGGDPEVWRQNIDLELNYIEKHFPDATTVSFGGGLKEARMPGETAADIEELGAYAKQQIEAFAERTGRELQIEIEPGTYIAANCGYAVTQVLDQKRTGEDGFEFVIIDGGMEINARPTMYGSVHPFYVISQEGKLLSSDFREADPEVPMYEAVIVGRCCESGDSMSLDEEGHIIPRIIAKPQLGDLVVVGGSGAYCSAMTPFNYNTHTQIPEVLLTSENELRLIRKKQTIEQIVMNEL